MATNNVLNRADIEMLRRVHVTDPREWGLKAGTDFWIVPAVGTWIGTAQGELLSEYGWTTTSLAASVAGSGADFMTASDKGTPAYFQQDAQNDRLESPAIFGDWIHAHTAMTLLGKKTLPRFMIADIDARFSTEANNQPTTAIGFTEDAGGGGVAATHNGAITSNSGTWGLSANGSEGTAYGTADTSFHQHRLIFNLSDGYIYPGVDGVMYDGGIGICPGATSNSTDGKIAITADELPAAFSVTSSGANNIIQFSRAHIWYAWKVPHWTQGAAW